jgi:hypothetical protein
MYIILRPGLCTGDIKKVGNKESRFQEDETTNLKLLNYFANERPCSYTDIMYNRYIII